MDSSIKQWHKSVLFASVALLACGGTAIAQPSDYISGPRYIINAFEASADGVLKGMGVWAVDTETYQLMVYDSWTAATTNGTFLGTGLGQSFSAGYVEVSLDSAVPLIAGDTYYARLRAYDWSTYGANFLNPSDNVSYFNLTGLPGSTWYDLYDDYDNVGISMYGGGAVTSRANFVTSLLISPPPHIEATALEGTWTITDQQFDGDHTLHVDKTANEMKPFVMQIDVDSDMDEITITEEVLNSIAERDWTGYGFQLGFWVDDRFVSSVIDDDLNFTTSQSSDVFLNPFTVLSEDHIQFGNGLVEPGDSVQFTLAIELPGGLDSYTFAIRQYAIPEPSSFLLLAMSGVILLCSRRRR